MRKDIEEIRNALVALNAFDDEAREALESLEHSIEEIEQHPVGDRVREVIVSTADKVKDATPDARVEGGVSGAWHELRDHLDEWEDHHPKLVLSVGKVAEALAVVGL